MFCPEINTECVGEKCRDWNKEEQKCQIQLQAISRVAMDKEYKKLSGFMEIFAESERLNTIKTQASLRSLLNLPMLPLESRRFIEEILEAPSSEVAEKLLKDMGLTG